MTLRHYQQRDLQLVRLAMREHRSVLLVQPTGAGKGTLAGEITRLASERGNRVLFLVNRRILVLDMSENRLDKLGIDHGIIMGNHPRRKPWLQCHVASIDTLSRRENLPKADILIVDEAHFAVTERWRQVFAQYPDAKILGMTATPIRLDGIGLGDVFEHLVQGPQVQELIDDGYLVPAVLLEPRDASIHGPSGKLNDKKAAAIMDRSGIHGKIVDSWLKHARGMKTVTFCQNQAHAHHVVEEYRSRGIGAEVVLDDTGTDDRKRIFQDLDRESGDLTHIVAVGVVSYGWDHPIVSCVQHAAMTDSIALILQRDGRGSRPFKGKKNMLILDHCQNHARNDVLYEDDREWSLEGMGIKQQESKKPAAIARCPKCLHSFRIRPKCPNCGHDMMDARPTVIPKETEAVMETVARQRKMLSIEQWRQRVPDDKRKYQFFAWLQLAEERGWKRGAPEAKFKAIFGHYPPKSKEWRDEYERNRELRKQGVGDALEAAGIL